MWCLILIHCLLVLGATAPPDKPKAARLSERKTWNVIRSEDGDFAFSMPAGPVLETRNVQGAAGPLEILTYSCAFEGSRYQLQRARASRPIAPARVIDELAHIRKRYLKENYRIVKETKIVVDGVIGDDFTYVVPAAKNDGEVTCETRHFMTKQFYYVLTVTSPSGRPLSSDAARFLSTITFEAVVKAHHARTALGPKVSARPEAKAPRGAARSKKDALGPRAKVKLNDSTPEAALKTFLEALAAQDEEILRAVALPDKDFDWLLKGRPVSAEALAQFKSRLDAKPMRRLKVGDPVRMPDGELRAVLSDDLREGRVVLWPDGAPLPSRVEKVDGRWKVFARPFIAARKRAASRGRQVGPKPPAQPPGPG